MSFTKYLSAAIIALAAFSFSVSAQAFERAERNASADGEKVDFKFRFGGFDHQVTGATGTITRGKISYKLPLEEGAGVEHLKIGRFQKDILVLLEQNFGGESNGTLVRVSESGKVRWTHRVPSFNLAGTVESNFAYVGGVGYMAKINLLNGRVVWAKDDFYNDDHGMIDVPAAPQITKNTVVMTQSPDSGQRSNPSVRIVFNKGTGAFIKE